MSPQNQSHHRAFLYQKIEKNPQHLDRFLDPGGIMPKYVNPPYNLDQTSAEHVYDGSITQGTDAVNKKIWDGFVNYGNEGCDIQILQNGAYIANDFWNYAPAENKTDSTTTVSGVNASGQVILNVVDGSVFTVGDYIWIGTVYDEKYRIEILSG